MLPFIFLIIFIFLVLLLISKLLFKILSKNNVEKLGKAECFEDLKLNSHKFIRYLVDGFVAGLPCVMNGSFLDYGINTLNLRPYLTGLFRICAYLPEHSIPVKFIESISEYNDMTSYEERFAMFEYNMTRLMQTTTPTGDVKLALDKLEGVVNLFPDIFDRYCSESRINNIDFSRYASYLLSLKEQINSGIEYLLITHPNMPEVAYIYSRYLMNVKFDKQEADAEFLIASELAENRCHIQPVSMLPLLDKAPAASTVIDSILKSEKNENINFNQIGYQDQSKINTHSPSKGFPVWIIIAIIYGTIILLFDIHSILKIQETYEGLGNLETIAQKLQELIARVSSHMYADINIDGLEPFTSKISNSNRSTVLNQTVKYIRENSAAIRKAALYPKIIHNGIQWYSKELYTLKAANVTQPYEYISNVYLSTAVEVLPNDAHINMGPNYNLMASSGIEMFDFFDDLIDHAAASMMDMGSKQIRSIQELFLWAGAVIFSMGVVAFLVALTYYFKSESCRLYCRDSDSQSIRNMTGVFLKLNHASAGQLVTYIGLCIVLLVGVFWVPAIYFHIKEGKMTVMQTTLFSVLKGTKRINHIGGVLAAAIIAKNKDVLPEISDKKLMKRIDVLDIDVARYFAVANYTNFTLVPSYVSFCRFANSFRCGDKVCFDKDVFERIEEFYLVNHIREELSSSITFMDSSMSIMLRELISLSVVSICTSLVVSIIFIPLISLFKHLHLIVDVCVEMRARITSSAVATKSGGNVVDLMDRPAATVMGGVVDLPNLQMIKRFGEIEELTGRPIPEEMANARRIEVDGGRQIVLAEHSPVTEYLAKRLKAMERDVERAREIISPSLSSADGDVVSEVIFELSTNGPDPMSSVFWDTAFEFETFLTDVSAKYKGTQSTNSIRGYSIVFHAPNPELAAMRAFMAASDLLLYVVDHHSPEIELQAAAVCRMAKPAEEGGAAQLKPLSDRYKLVQNSMLVDNDIYSTVFKIIGDLKLDSLVDSHIVLTDKDPFVEYQ